MIANIPKVQLEKRCLCTFCYTYICILNGRILDIINCLILSKLSIFFFDFGKVCQKITDFFLLGLPITGAPIGGNLPLPTFLSILFYRYHKNNKWQCSKTSSMYSEKILQRLSSDEWKIWRVRKAEFVFPS